jgi:hypothetical protein
MIDEMSAQRGQNPNVAMGSHVQFPVLQKYVGRFASVLGAVTRAVCMLRAKRGSV